MKYRFKIFARPKDAIGIREIFTGDIEAGNKIKAKRELYETFEHIEVMEMEAIK